MMRMFSMLALLCASALAVAQPSPFVSPPSAATTVGSPIVGGTATRILYEGTGPVLADSANLTFDGTATVDIGSNGAATTGWKIGTYGSISASALWTKAVTASGSNYTLYSDATSTYLNSAGAGNTYIQAGGATKVQFASTAGAGPAITAGTAASAVSAQTITQTWSYNSAAIQGVDWTFTDTSSHSGTNAFRIRAGASGTTSLLILDKNGSIALGGSTVQLANQSAIRNSADGVLALTNAGNTSGVTFRATGTPTCSTNCGTSPSVVGNDSAGTVTMGASGVPASGWVLTFQGTWAAAPACHVSPALAGMAVGKLPIVVATTTTTMTVTTNGTAPATSDVYTYQCIRGV